jgi:hypothetical protein
MEKRINDKITDSNKIFKQNITKWFTEHGHRVTANSDGRDATSDFLKYIYDAEHVAITSDDFQKKTRIRSDVPDTIRCCAKRANGEQCSRRKKDDSDMCGTHSKGSHKQQLTKKIKLSIIEYKGIHYHIDNQFNVYSPEDVLNAVDQPRIIAKWYYDNDGSVTINT